MNPNAEQNDELRPEYDFSKGMRGVHASRFSKLSSDEAFVLGYWNKEGFNIGGFAKSEMRGSKTPDFRLSRNGVDVAYCEVKSFQRDEWLEEQIKKSPAGSIAGGLRPDPIFNRISNAIHTAALQFESVNSSHDLLNFLFLVNHDTSATADDLDRVLTGFENVRMGILDPTCTQCSNGRIREQKTRIDLYVWQDYVDGKLRGSVYRVMGNPETRRWVCGLLGIDPSVVRNIPTAA